MAGFGDFMGMLRNMGSLRDRVAETQGELERERVTGSAGGGMVTVTLNGRGEVVDVGIDPEVVDPAETELLADMVKAAFGQALEKSREVQREGLQKVLGGLPIPPGLANLIG
jgi:DNA-binding YbaB/EbfC family protein